MIFTSILNTIVAKALPLLNRNLPSIYFTRISTILFLYAGVLNFNTFYIQLIGSGIGTYSGLFQITQISVLIESFILFISSLILISWPLLSRESRLAEQMFRRSELSVFVIVGAPLVLIGIRMAGLSYRDFITINLPLPNQNPSNLEGTGSNLAKRSLFLFSILSKSTFTLPN
jgi:hypothetical protein